MTERARAAFEGAIPVAARASMVHDPALDLVAAAFAETTSEESRGMAGPVLTWLFWHASSTSMYLAARARWWTGPGAAENLDAELVELARQLGGDDPRSYGVARFASGRMTWQAVVLGRRPLAAVHLLRKCYAPVRLSGSACSLMVHMVEPSST